MMTGMPDTRHHEAARAKITITDTLRTILI